MKFTRPTIGATIRYQPALFNRSDTMPWKGVASLPAASHTVKSLHSAAISENAKASRA